jgi:hypothetical protein
MGTISNFNFNAGQKKKPPFTEEKLDDIGSRNDKFPKHFGWLAAQNELSKTSALTSTNFLKLLLH